MKNLVGWIAVLTIAISTFAMAEEKVADDKAAADKPAVKAAATVPAVSPFKTKAERVSYAIGMSIGQNFKRDELDIDIKVFTTAIKDALAGGEMKMTEEQAMTAINELRTEMMAKAKAKSDKAAAENVTKGKAYLEANKVKEGVVTTASGLQYKVVTPGEGKSPTAEDTVVVNYRGTLIDGEEFDSSYKRGQPATFRVGQVIPGWQEALQLMKVGTKLELVIPAELAYGQRGGGPKIGPNAVLKFDVELLEIKAKADDAPKAEVKVQPAK